MRLQHTFPLAESIIKDYKNLLPYLSNGLMQFFPKILLISVASLFENEIKQTYNKFTMHPMITGCKASAGTVYKKFHTEPLFSTINFDNYFTRPSFDFKSTVEQHFNQLKVSEVLCIDTTHSQLKAVHNPPEETSKQIVEYEGHSHRLNNLRFDDAWTTFLELKSLRNKIAHDFTAALSHTFDDITLKYYNALLYVKAVQNTLKSITKV